MCRATVVLAAVALVACGSSDLRASGWAPGPSVSPAPGTLIPPPALVPGKEYTDLRDKNDLGVGDPDQVLAWDGFGGTADGYDYSGSLLAFQLPANNEVDALAAPGDALYRAVIADRAALAFSVSGYNAVHVEPVLAAGGSGAAYMWASPAQIDANGVHDIDALELWGSNASPKDDAFNFSIAGDPFATLATGAAAKVSVWQYDGVAASSPLIFTSDLAAAIDMQYGGPGVGGPLWSQLVELMDLDGLMSFGGEAIFSIRPIALSQTNPLLPDFDGGEIFVYSGALQPTTFLQHGGHLWDTPFNVAATFGLPSENVEALEAIAIPEPSTIGLLAGVMLLARRFRI